jgi:hypothetical protein
MFAATGGHIECLKWARANECPWDGETLRCAEANGHDDIVEWARANGCPEPEENDESDEYD